MDILRRATRQNTDERCLLAAVLDIQDFLSQVHDFLKEAATEQENTNLSDERKKNRR